MYFSSLKLFEVLKFFQFLMLFENQFLDTSSNFGAPFFKGFTLSEAIFAINPVNNPVGIDNSRKYGSITAIYPVI